MTMATGMVEGIWAQPFVHALGWTLVHFCWQGTAVAVLLWCALGLLEGRSARVRYAAALCALGLMVAAPVATFAHVAAAEYRLRALLMRPAFDLDGGILVQVGAGDLVLPWTVRACVALDHACEKTMPWLLLAWMVGVALFLARLHVGFAVARRMRLVTTEPAEEELIKLFEGLRRRIGVRGAVNLMQSAVVQVPTVIGWLRPVVLVPVSCLTGLSAVQIEAILAHELAHVRRHDYLVSVAQSVVEALLFYHPAVWWVSKQVRRERECCCDDVAVRISGDRLGYARALSSLEEYRAGLPAMMLGANGGVLTMRIGRLLGLKESAAGHQVAAAVVLAVLLTTAVGTFGRIAGAEAKGRVSAARVAVPVELETPAPLDLQIAMPVASVAEVSAGLGNLDGQGSSGDMGPYLRQVYADVQRKWVAPGGGAGNEARAVIAFSIVTDGTIGSMDRLYWAAKRPADSDALNRAALNAITRVGHFPPLPAGFAGQKLELRLAFDGDGLMQEKSGVGPANVPAGAIVRSTSSTVGAVAEFLCQPQIVGNQRVPSNSILTRLVSRQGDAFDAATVKEDFDSLWATGYFESVRIERVDTAKCVQLVVHVEEKPVVRTANYETAASDKAMQAQAPSTASGPVQVSSAAMAGNLIDRPDPVYPPIAKAAHVSGAVVLHALISKTGTIESLSAVSGPPMLIASAKDAVKRWVYKPYLLNGEPVEVETTITVNFTFGDAAPPLSAAELRQGGLPIRVSAGAMAGSLILRRDPAYPAEARTAGVQGSVVLRAVISKAGDIEDLKVISGPPELTKSAIDAVKQWKYRPYLLNGEPVEVDTTITVNYSLVDSGESAKPVEMDGAEAEPKKIGGAVSRPKLLFAPDPNYSEQARAEKVSGNILVNLWVDEKGNPTHVRVARGIGHGLDEKAVEAVQGYKFKPAMEDGKPVTVSLNVEVNFQIF